jgi:hypothetical protein
MTEKPPIGTWVRLTDGLAAEVVGYRTLWDCEYVELLREWATGGPARPVPGLRPGEGYETRKRSRALCLERLADLRPVTEEGPTARYLEQCKLLCPNGIPVREWPETGPRPGQQLGLGV